MTVEEMRTNLIEPKVEGLSFPWDEEGKELHFRFSHEQEEDSLFGKNTAFYGTLVSTGEIVKCWATLAIKQAFLDQNIVGGDVVLIKFVAQVGQFKRFAVAVEHVPKEDELPF